MKLAVGTTIRTDRIRFTIFNDGHFYVLRGYCQLTNIVEMLEF